MAVDGSDAGTSSNHLDRSEVPLQDTGDCASFACEGHARFLITNILNPSLIGMHADHILNEDYEPSVTQYEELSSSSSSESSGDVDINEEVREGVSAGEFVLNGEKWDIEYKRQLAEGRGGSNLADEGVASDGPDNDDNDDNDYEDYYDDDDYDGVLSKSSNHEDQGEGYQASVDDSQPVDLSAAEDHLFWNIPRIPQDAWIVPVTTTLLVPVFAVADEDNIVSLVVSTLYQRHVLGIDMPVVGMKLASDGCIGQLVFGWLAPQDRLGPENYVSKVLSSAR